MRWFRVGGVGVGVGRVVCVSIAGVGGFGCGLRGGVEADGREVGKAVG